MKKHFVFTMTTGRSGTAFLAELFRQNYGSCESHHEIISFSSFGVDTPDLSHLTRFNSEGNIPHVRQFWQQKLKRIANTGSDIYVETSHVLLKAGLVENLELLAPHGHIRLINLTRNVYETLKSFVIRRDFQSSGQSLMWYLSTIYPKIIYKIPATSNILVQIAWYITEMRCRSAYYKAFLNDRSDVKIFDIDLQSIKTLDGVKAFLPSLQLPSYSQDVSVPPPMNMNTYTHAKLSPRDEEVLQKAASEIEDVDTTSLGAEAYARGFRF